VNLVEIVYIVMNDEFVNVVKIVPVKKKQI